MTESGIESKALTSYFQENCHHH